MSTPGSSTIAVYVAVAAGGAIGATLRHAINLTLKGIAGAFPLSTLLVNVLGSFVIGLIVAWAAAEGGEPGLWRGMVQVVLLGSLTTFSTFSVETLVLMEAGRGGLAGLSVALNLALALGGCWAGLTAGRLIW